LEVIDSRFLVEYFFSSDENVKSKTLRHLKDLVKKRNGILPTIVVTETVRYVCEKRGVEEAKIRYLSTYGLASLNPTETSFVSP